MTDKQIINGVDIGWCKNYNEANSKDCETLYICKENPNCYYKQLKRKEQECERLTSKCSQLEEEIKDWQKEVERIQFIGSYGIMDEVKKNTKLEQTLTEIKKIADNYTKRNYADFKFALQQILQKISEVEE